MSWGEEQMTTTAGSSRRRLRRTAMAAAAVAAAMLGAASAPALADFGIRPDNGKPSGYDFVADVFDELGNVDPQAGKHPFAAKTSFSLNATDNGMGASIPDGNLKEIVVDLPAGLVGNPEAAATCTLAQMKPPWPADRASSCPIDSQVGLVRLELYNNGANFYVTYPVYNMQANRNEVAAFGFMALLVPVRLSARLRSDGDYGITATSSDINATVAVSKVDLELWGVPGDPSHDPYRGLYEDGILFGGTPFPPNNRQGGNIRSTSTPRAFFTSPVDCSHGVYTTRMRMTSWQRPNDWLAYEAKSASGVTGCDKLTFQPTIDVQPDSKAPGAPTGMRVELAVPQNDNPTALATPVLKKAIVRLPEGMRVSPSSADGLGACSDAQLALRSDAEPTCPDSSKLGTVTIDTPLLAEPLQGEIILGEQKPSQLLNLVLVARGRGGLILKLPGKVDPDPVTGQLTATFDDNPQLPFHKLVLQFKGGPRAPLSNPNTCGVKTTTTELTAWSGQVAAPSSSFTIGGEGVDCAPLGFTPSFSAGTTNAVAGADSTFSLTFGRDDNDQDLKDINIAMPRGVTGRLAQIPLCPEALAAAGACDEGSRIGSVTSAAGPGTNPLYLPGRAYLTEGYRGQPFGLSIVVPAIAGPFNLGNVVVRASIAVDRYDASLRIAADPLPSILMGIPLQVRTVNVHIDRPGFMINPTNCTPSQVSAVVSSQQGASANVSSRFQVGDCGALPFKPKMTIRMGARGRTRAGITAPLNVSLRMTSGQANNRSVAVALPRNVNARLKVINERACTIDQFNSATCPASNRIGTAKAVTPLLKDPLQGDAFFVRNPARRIPDLMVALRGQVAIDLTGKVTINRNLTLRTDFDTIPDVPISTFDLNLVAGRNGPIGFVANACTKAAKAERATISYRSQSGRFVRAKQKLQIVGCSKSTRRASRAKKPAAKNKKVSNKKASKK
jgi:hypothetical protein